MPTYRCTRTALYLHLNEPARSDTSRRQGHYINADSPEDAIAVMTKRFPGDADISSEPFTVQEWTDSSEAVKRRKPVQLKAPDLQCPNCKLDHCEHMQQLAAQAIYFVNLGPKAYAEALQNAMFDLGLVLQSAGQLFRADAPPRW